MNAPLKLWSFNSPLIVSEDTRKTADLSPFGTFRLPSADAWHTLLLHLRLRYSEADLFRRSQLRTPPPRVRLHLLRIGDDAHDLIQQFVISRMSTSVERAGEEIRLHSARRYGFHANSKLVQFERHAFAPALNRLLRRMVDRVERDGH